MDRPLTGVSPRCFGKLVTAVRRKQDAAPQRGRPWSLPLENRILLVTAYWRTNLTMRRLAPLFGISKSAAGPMLALQQRKRSSSMPIPAWSSWLGRPVPGHRHDSRG